MQFKSEDIFEITVYISKDRLWTFRKLTKSDSDAIYLHQQTMQLGAALMLVLGTIEIAIRNYICLRLDQHFSSDDWLFSPPPPFVWKQLERQSIDKAKRSAQRAEYQNLNQGQKHELDALVFPNGRPANLSHEQVVKKRLAAINVASGQIIAQLTLFFWKRLFSEEYERTLWKRGLKTVFPNKRLSRSTIANHLEILYQARNRIAHHEPIYGRRLENIIESIQFLTENLAIKYPTKDTAFAKLLQPHQEKLDVEVLQFQGIWNNLTRP